MSEKLNWSGFCPTDILLPEHCDMSKWSVVACDQYTSQPEYWQRVADYVGDAPSTLRMILPEVYLGDGHLAQRHANIHQAMEDSLKSGFFRCLPDSMIYVERWLGNNTLRRGLVGAVDLECYDYNLGSSNLIRATEGTVLSRIPPRVAVRRQAPLELPHVLMLIDDPEKRIIEHLTYETEDMEQVYDFDLMEGGGHITGYLLNEEQKADVCELLSQLGDEERFRERYHTAADEKVMIYAVGDGNHSLASARDSYLELRNAHPEYDWETHPARFAMVELGNLHDDSLQFEAIHRVCFNVDPEGLLQELIEYYPGTHFGEGEGHSFRYVWAGGSGVITVPDPDAQLAVGTLQGFLDKFLLDHFGSFIDYVHGEDVVQELAVQKNNIGFILAPMAKEELFMSVIHDGALPRKTFSMGEAQDKRFYLEARKIK